LDVPARRLFPEAYTEMSLAALGLVEERLGRENVVALFQRRARELHERHRDQFAGPELPARVRELARLREEGGYLAEVGRRRAGTTELLEHNCPILAIAGTYPEACEVERRMFEGLLRAEVDVTHRVVAGDGVCRFLIRARREIP
jgi:predicted ArsR family transcriptional regulator